MNGKEALRHIRNGCEITPTDKSYKMYIRENGQTHAFYFSDFTKEEAEEFETLLLADKLTNIAIPGYFYSGVHLPQLDKVYRIGEPRE